jgi:small subunit ribosomal protein S5
MGALMENENKVVEEKIVSENADQAQTKKKTSSEFVKVDASGAPADKKPFRRFDRSRKGQDNRQGRGIKAKEYDENVVNISRVTKVIKGGKRIKFQALVVIGDHKGKYGFGIGKSGEVPDAIKKAVEAAKKNMYKINIVKGDTISHDNIGKFGATSVFLKPAKPGTGIVAGGPVRAVLELAGIKNVYSKVHGSRTSINIIRATHAALSSLKSYTHVQELRNK